MPAWTPPDLEFWSVPRLWPGEAVAILAGGSSLTQEQVEYCRDRCRVISINRAFMLAPWADMLFGCDADRFWALHPEATFFEGIKVVVRGARDLPRERWRQLKALSNADVKVLRHSGLGYPVAPRHEGISPDPAVVRGNCSLFQILSVIAHTGASTVLLLGADMHGAHWHEGYPGIGQPDYASSVIPQFQSLVKPLAAAGVAVLNASVRSALPSEWFPHMRLEDVL